LLEWLLDPNNYAFWLIIIGLIVGAVGIISRPFSTYVKFVYPNAKFEAIGNPFITEKELSRLIDNKDLVNFKDSLNSSKDYNISGEDIESIQYSLDKNFHQSVKMMQSDSSKKMKYFFEAYLEKIDIYLIKNSIKTIIEGKKLDQETFEKAYLPETKEFLLKLVDVEKDKIPDILRENNFTDEIIKSISSEEINFIKIDIEFDRYVIDKLRNVKVPYKCEPAKQRFVYTLIDLINIKNIMRAKQIGYSEKSCLDLYLEEGQEIAFWKFKEISGVESVPQVISALDGTSYFSALKDAIEDYNEEKSVQVLENALDSRFLGLIKNISIKNYVTIGPTIRFIVNKEFEIQNLKAIVKGLGEDMPSEFINKILVKEAST
jgi:vacuolar-type H+-ATPase subunit C/Vma6